MYVIELASTTTKRLTGVEGKVGSGVPDWSPDGREIVYEKFLSNGGGFAHKNIYLMRANGEQQRPLLPDPQEGVATVIMRFFPRWSADGNAFYFMKSTGVAMNESVTSPFSESAAFENGNQGD